MKFFLSSQKKSNFHYFYFLIALLTFLLLNPNLAGCSNNLTNKSKSEPIIMTDNIPYELYISSDPVVIFLEHPIFDRILTKPEPNLPQEVNEYFLKTSKYKQQLVDKNLPESAKIEAVFLLESQGEERILVIGGKRFSEEFFYPDTLYLFNSTLTLLEERELGWISSHFTEYFVSARFRDRIWIQSTSEGGSNGYKYIYFIRLQNNKLHIDRKYCGDLEFTGLKTYKIINSDTDPKMVLHKNNQFYWDYFFLVWFILASLYDFFVEYWLILVIIGFLMLSISFVLLWFEKKHLHRQK